MTIVSAIAIPWTEDTGNHPIKCIRQPISGKVDHTYSSNPGANVAFADDSVRFLPGGLLASEKSPDLLKVGGVREEYMDAGWSDGERHIHWSNCTAFAVWLASTGWLLVRAVRSRKKAVVSAVE